MKVHNYSFRVEWGDTDAAGIVYSPNFYKWMDQAAHYYFESIGFPLSKLVREDKIGIPLIESKCNFQRPLYFEDDVVIKTTIFEMRDKVVHFVHEFYKGEQKIANGHQIRAIARIGESSLKAISIPDPMREAIIASGIIQQSNVI